MEINATAGLDFYHRMEELEAEAEKLRYASTVVDSNARDLATSVGEQGRKVIALSQATDEVRQQVTHILTLP